MTVSSDFGGLASGPGRFDSTHSRGGASGLRYPSPFFDISHTYLPTSVKQMFRWCRYYFLINPVINAITYKMAEYPITPLVVDEPDEDLRRKWEGVINTQLRLRSFQVEVGLDYFCFAAGTPVVTQTGTYPIEKLSGQTVNVLSRDGQWRSASFKSYGTQRLYEISFCRGEKIYATAEHQWPIIDTNGREHTVTTLELQGKYLQRNVPRTKTKGAALTKSRPVKDKDYWDGLRHGIVFGDGSLSNEGRQAHVIFYKNGKKQELIRYFEDYTCTPHHAGEYVAAYGLPPSYKSLPTIEKSNSYWYGFVCGLLATDGSIDENGQSNLHQKAGGELESVAQQLPRFGMIGRKLRQYDVVTNFGPIVMERVALATSFMCADDFVRSDQRQCFLDAYDDEPSSYGLKTRVTSVVETDRVEEVYCCVEPETHTFTVGNGVLTGNCYGNSFVTIHFPFIKYLICANCEEEVPIKRADYKFRNNQYELLCSKCHVTTQASVRDQNIKDKKGIRLLRWNPENITVEHNEITGETAYFYEIPMAVRNDIAMGKRHLIETIPDIFLESIRQNKTLRLIDENLFHLKRPTIAEKDMGWGMPLLLPVMKDAYYLQILRKAQEMIAQQHIVPLNMLFPQANGASADPFSTTDLGTWRRRMEQELEKWRLDPNYMPIMPLPVGNETIGGDGKALMLHQEMRAWTEQMIAGMQVPIEFFFGGLSYSGSNMSMRMLENQFLKYRNEQQIMCQDFILGKIADYMEWKRPAIHFKRFKMADDLQRLGITVQLNQMQKISDTTLLDECDYDLATEEKYKKEEMAKQLENQRHMQLAQADLQGQVMVTQAKYQAQVQKLMMAMGVPQAGGEAPPLPDVSQMGLGGPPGGADASGGAPSGPGGPQIPGGLGSGTQQPMDGQEVAPGMPAGSTIYPENATAPPTEGMPAEMMSPLTSGMQQGGVNLLYLARRAATHLNKLDEGSKFVELMKMKANPQLYSLVLQCMQKEQGAQTNPLDPMTMPMPEMKPPRRDGFGAGA